jgi:hypothetical protein
MGAESADVAATIAETPPVADANEPEVQQGAESAPAVTNADEETTKVLDPVQKRIDELTRKRYEAQRDAEYWREQAQRAQRQEQAPAKPPEAQAAGKKLADFGYDEAQYQDYLFEQARTHAVKAAREELTREQQTTQAQRRASEFAEFEAEFAKDVPDYFEVTRGKLRVTNEVADVILSSGKQGPALANYLGLNPGIASKINQLPLPQAAMELGRISAKLSEKPKPLAISGAPPPAPRLENAGNPVVSARPDTAESDKLSDAEWTARRNKQVAKQRGK